MTSQLLAIATSSRHRYLLVLAGDDAWLSRVVSEFRQQAIARELLYVGDQALDGVESTSAKQAMRWLGRETDLVIMDARQGVDADALGAVAGIIRGGGLLVLLRHAEGNTGTAFKSKFLSPVFQHIAIALVILVVAFNIYTATRVFISPTTFSSLAIAAS